MRRYVVFAVVGLALLFTSISGTVVTVAFPAIISAFHTSLITAGWVLGVNQLAATAGMPLAGKACDVWGRKFTFLLCVGLFTLGSLLSALAPNIELLIFFRFIQGLGAGGFLPAATSIVAEEFPQSRQQSIGFFSTIFPIGQIIGPTIGAWLTTAFGWQSNFWFCVPLGVIVFIPSILFLRKSHRSDSHLDLVGGGIFTGMVVAIMAGISLIGGSQGAVSWLESGLFFAAAITLLVVFLWRLTRVKEPIIDVQVLREKPFIASNAFNFLYGVSVLGINNFIPFYAVTVYGMSTLQSGLIVTPRSIGMIIASIITSFYLVRWGYRKPMLIGTAVIALTLFLLSLEVPGLNLAGISLSSTVVLSGIMLVIGLSVGSVAPAANNACIELMPTRIGTITGVRGMFRQVGGAISVSITSLFLNNSPNLNHGFRIVFLAFMGLALFSLPIILLVPKSPGACATEAAPEPDSARS